MPHIEVHGGTGDGSWASDMEVSRVPNIGEKIVPKVPFRVAGGASRMECTVLDVVHYEGNGSDQINAVVYVA